jgi:uncharacterized protein
MRASLLLIALALGTTAFAQDTINPAKRASIEELLSLMKVDRTIEQTLPQVQRIMAQSMKDSLPAEIRDSQDNAKVTAELQDLQNRLFDLLKNKITYANMKPDYVRLYDETFSTDEIAGVVAFYKTSAGQAYLAKLPVLTTKTVEFTQRMMSGLMPEIQKMTAAWSEEMKKKYGNPGAAK